MLYSAHPGEDSNQGGNKMTLQGVLAPLILLGCAQAQLIRLGESTQINGISPTFGVFGQVTTTFQGQLGTYPFYQPADKPVQIFPLQGASITGINEQCLSGILTTIDGIAGFQQCTDKNGNVQTFEFFFGANATLIFSQIPGTNAVAGYFYNFHLQDTGFVSTPVFDSDGKILKYNTTFFSVPGAASTHLVTANQHGIAGQFQNSKNTWSGFVQRTGQEIETINFPGAIDTGITALGARCYAGYYDMADGVRHGFLHCDDRPSPINDAITLDLGNSTWITQITDTSAVVGYAEGANGNLFGFVWEGLTSRIR